MKKRALITMVLAGILSLANAQNNSITEGHVQLATTICRVLGDGRKVETVVLQYDTPIRNKSHSAESFTVEGKDGQRLSCTVSNYRQDLYPIALKSSDGK